jgi:hypothetical protein
VEEQDAADLQQLVDEVQEEALDEDQAGQQQDAADPLYAELELRAPPPQVPVRRPRSRRGSSDPQLPTRMSGRFRGPGDEPLASLPYTGRPI